MKIITAKNKNFKVTAFYILNDNEYEHIMRGYEEFQNAEELLEYLSTFESYNTEFITTTDDIVFYEHTQEIKLNFDFVVSE